LKVKKIWILFVFVLVLAACSAPPAAQPAPGTPTGAPENEAAGVTIVLEMSGGIAGKMEKWVIYPDGRVTANGAELGTASAEQVQALVRELEGLGFYELEDRYGHLSTCNDCFNFTILLLREQGEKTVSYVDGGSGVPEQVFEITARIHAFLSELEP
jgi:hypothetical protein